MARVLFVNPVVREEDNPRHIPYGIALLAAIAMDKGHQVQVFDANAWRTDDGVLMDALGTRIIRFYHAEAHFEHVKELYATYDYWIVFVAAFTPIPYKVFTITSGVMGMNLVVFAAVSAVGRGVRFFIVAYLLYLFGQPMKRFIDRYFDLLSIALLILIVAGFAVLSYF